MLSIRDIVKKKGKAPIVCLTAYTTPMARLMDGVADIVLVGDSLGMVMHGLPNTVGVTLEMMRLHGQAVARGVQKSCLVIDLPFGSYQQSKEQAFEAAAYLLQETGAQAVKLEGGMVMAETVEFLTARGVPVMAHIGLQPQSVLANGYKREGKNAREREALMKAAHAHQQAGAFAVLMECVEAGAAEAITQALDIPTIGIGSGAACDGQILVTEDILGMSDYIPNFAMRYTDIKPPISDAITAYADAVRKKKFPK